MGNFSTNALASSPLSPHPTPHTLHPVFDPNPLSSIWINFCKGIGVMALTVGTIAPNFNTTDDTGKTVSLSDFQGTSIPKMIPPVAPKKRKASGITTKNTKTRK